MQNVSLAVCSHGCTSINCECEQTSQTERAAQYFLLLGFLSFFFGTFSFCCCSLKLFNFVFYCLTKIWITFRWQQCVSLYCSIKKNNPACREATGAWTYLSLYVFSCIVTGVIHLQCFLICIVKMRANAVKPEECCVHNWYNMVHNISVNNWLSQIQECVSHESKD